MSGETGERTNPIDPVSIVIVRDLIVRTITADPTVCECRPGKLPAAWCRPCAHAGKDGETIASDMLEMCGWTRQLGADTASRLAAVINASALEAAEQSQ